VQIDGMDWAGSFAFSAFFYLFQIIILFVTIAAGCMMMMWAPLLFKINFYFI